MVHLAVVTTAIALVAAAAVRGLRTTTTRPMSDALSEWATIKKSRRCDTLLLQ
jgi:hypothetical protein